MGNLLGKLFKWILSHPEAVTAIKGVVVEVVATQVAKKARKA